MEKYTKDCYIYKYPDDKYGYIYEYAMNAKYISYNIYRCPERPTKRGEYIGKTPMLEQAVQILKTAEKQGRSYLVKGVTEDGTEVLFL